MRYAIPAARTHIEEVIMRSRFITTLGPAATVEEARAFVASMRAEYADASHNCFAYVVGPPGTTAQVGMSDDGEPGGTAGRPMLAVLLGSKVGDVVAVVTRYFGGTKLGKGGLVRAYSSGVKAALAELAVIEKVARVTLLAHGPYRWVTPVLRLLPEYEARIIEQTYGAEVTWRIEVPEEFGTALAGLLVDASHGEIEVVFQ
jgi:uncharacterized YigZ family protein